MNNRIKLLSDEAHEFALKTIEYGENFGDIWIEKFAELMVQEGVEIVDKAEPYKSGDLIKKHFGTNHDWKPYEFQEL